MYSDRQDLALQWLLRPLLEDIDCILNKKFDEDKETDFVDFLSKLNIFFTEEIEKQVFDVCFAYEKFKEDKSLERKVVFLNSIEAFSENLKALIKPSHLSQKEITLLHYASTELIMIRDLIQVESDDFYEQAVSGLESLSKNLFNISKRVGETLNLIANYLKEFNAEGPQNLPADARSVIARIVVATEIFVENLINLEFKFESVFDRVESDIFWLSSNTKQEDQVSVVDPEVIKMFSEELKEEVDEIKEQCDGLKDEISAKDSLNFILNSIHTIKGSSFIVGAKNISAYAEEIEETLKKYGNSSIHLNENIHDILNEFCEILLNHLNKEEHSLDIERSSNETVFRDGPKNKAIDCDPELIAIFLDESQDIMSRVVEQFNTWKKSPNDRAVVAELHRELHTLKGGARMVGQDSIADLAHELERLYSLMAEDKAFPAEADFEVIANCHDVISNMLDDFKEKKEVASSASIIKKLRNHFSFSAGDSSSAADVSMQTKKSQDVAIGKITQNKEEHQEKKSVHEMIRVSAAELESLYHVAGEASASRSHMAQSVSHLNRVFSDLLMLSKRLSEQIRQLEIQADLQLLNRHKTATDDKDIDFDPIEFDRYSRIQQLTRNMSETVSEILARRDDQSKIIKALEFGFESQKKTQNELRSGLLRTQMVYFSNILPRLNRVVKQTADAVNKKCELISNKLDIEVDRNLLNHVAAPLEHMLRNAVDHGIEKPEIRKKSGKNEIGKIFLSLRREGGEIFIEVSDDGAGISIEDVRGKAIEKGLMREEDQLSKNQILRFILESGFSTREKVTQISGRGVGMDVVYNEVKELGGHLLVETEEGKGTKFIIHLPFTQSLHRALIFKVENEQYALQLSSIKSIERLDAKQAEKFIIEPGSFYEHGGTSYAIVYCGNLLTNEKIIKKPQVKSRYPLLLLRTRTANLGLLIDEIEGSRDVLLKPLSPELRQLRLLAGATELSEGMLSFILDPEGLVERAETLYRIILSGAVLDIQESVLENVEKKQHAPEYIYVLVVDDSMTVRRVTSHFLTGRGFKVKTAKDGLDALTIMQAEKPDVVLIDIEMPRMDGFSCVAKMKEDPVLKTVPVIMISSRTAQKHRDRATSLGVEYYFGKPYQEEVLFKTIMAATEGKI